MADLLFIALMIVFFALAVLLVRACDLIIGPDEDVIIGTVESTDDGVEIAA
jgi:hypothetical protein